MNYFIVYESVLVITVRGLIRLRCPFRVEVNDNTLFIHQSLIIVDYVRYPNQHTILFKIEERWYPSSLFNF